MDNTNEKRLRSFLEVRKKLELTSPSLSTSPLETFEKKKFFAHAFDTELVNLPQLKPGQAGYRQPISSINPITGTKITSGTTMLGGAVDMVQFGVVELNFAKNKISEKLNLFRAPTPELATAEWAAEDVSGPVKELIFGEKGKQYGKSTEEFRQAIKDYFGSLNPNKKFFLLGYNVDKADREWLRQFGADLPSNIHYVDVLDLARIAFKNQSFAGGLKLESLNKVILQGKGTAHDAVGDSETTANLFKYIIGSHWTNMSQAQQEMIYRHLSPIINNAPAIASRSFSDTINFFQAASGEDPYLLRRYKFVKEGALFLDAPNGDKVLGTVFHTGSKRGLRHIAELIGGIDQDARREFFKTYRDLQKYSNGRLEFLLKKENNLDYLYLVATDKAKNLGGNVRHITASAAVPLQQVASTGQKSLVTLGNRRYGVRGGFLQQTSTGGFRLRSFTGLSFEGIRRGLSEEKFGGIIAEEGFTNLSPNFLKAIISNAERMKVFAGGENDLDFSAVRYDSSGKKLSSRSLKTALTHIGSMAGEKTGNLAALERDIQFLLEESVWQSRSSDESQYASAEVPAVRKIKEIFKKINIDRTNALKQGKAYTDSDASMRGLKDAAKALLDLFKENDLESLGLTFYGVKPESAMRGIFSSLGGIHSGITKRTGPKGSFELRSIDFFPALKTVSRGSAGWTSSSIDPQQMVPRGLISGIKGARKRGLSYIPGRTVKLGVIPVLTAEDYLAAHAAGGDSSLIATQRGLNKLKRGATNKKVFVTDLHTDLLRALSLDQIDELTKTRGKLSDLNLKLQAGHKLGINYGPGGVNKLVNLEGKLLSSKGKILEVPKLVGISTVRGQHGYYLEFSSARSRGADKVGRSAIVGGLRATISSTVPEGAYGNVDFISYSEFYNESDLRYQHYISRINAAKQGKAFHSFLEKKLGQKIDFFEEGDQFFYEAPKASSKELEAAAQQFALNNAIDITIPTYNLTAKEAKARGVAPGTSVNIYDQMLHMRAGERDDIGTKIGGALRIRLKDAEEAQIRATASGFKGISPSARFLEMAFRRNSRNANNFRTYAKYLATGGDPNVIKGIKTYTLAEIRAGALETVNTSGFLNKELVKGTIVQKHKNKLFAIDLGSDVGAIPLGLTGTGKNRIKRALNNRRILLFPSAVMTGFGLSEGATKISTTDPFMRFVAGINLLKNPNIDIQAALAQFYAGYEGFHKDLFGKDKLLEKHFAKSRGIKQSVQLRNILSTRSKYGTRLKGSHLGAHIGTVELEEGYIRRYQKELGLSDDFIKRIKDKNAYGMVTVNPHISVQHSATVRFAFRKGSESSLSESIGTHAFLSKLMRRDYDKDKFFAMFFDTENVKMQESLEREWKHLAKTAYTSIGTNTQATFNALYDIDVRKKQGQQSTAQSLEEMMVDFVKSKGMAANPHLKIKGEEIFLRPDAEFSLSKGGLGKEQLKARIAKNMYASFGLESKGMYGRIREAIDISADLLNVSGELLAKRYQNWAVLQEELYQHSLQKAGPLQEAAMKFGDEISTLQVKAWDMFAANKGQKGITSQVFAQLKSDAELAARNLAKAVEAEKGLLNLGAAVRFDDKVGMNQLFEDFATSQAMMHTMYGAYGFELSDGNKGQREYFLNRSHAARALMKRGASPDQMPKLFSFLGLTEEGFDITKLGIAESKAMDAFRDFIPTNIEDMAAAAADQMAGGGSRAKPFLESLEKAGSKLSETITQGSSELVKAISNMSPVTKMGLLGLGAYGAYSQIVAGDASDPGTLSAPSIESSRVMKTSVPRNPMISTPDVRYPDPINPASYRNKALIQRNAPMIQFHGRQISNNPYSSAMDLADTIGSANINNGQLNIYDNRVSSDMQAQFAARDTLASDY